jgi:3-(3-hydroxy-phenyl)propionate hydroxylase
MTISAIEDQVIIVGAGPVGLMLARLLDDLDISCLVFEAETQLPRDLRASTFHPPTLDMLDRFGLGEALLARGRICPSWQVRVHETHEYAEFDLSVLADLTGHPYRLQCEQIHLSDALLSQLQGSGRVPVLAGHRVVEVSQSDEGVSALIEGSDGERYRVAGRFLVGADGARSTVRQSTGFAFQGKTYPETTMLATTDFAFEQHLPGLSNVNYVWRAGGTFSLMRLPDTWRCSLYPDEGESLEEALTPERIEAKLQRIVPTGIPYSVGERRAYRVHMRIVDDYRKGRVLLAGDAAHINSPSGGMGMNGGIHDAFCLAPLLAQAMQGAPIEALDLYTRKRRGVAADEILQQADRNRARMQERDPDARRHAFEQLKATTADRNLMRAHLIRSSMIAGLQRAEAQA